MKKTIHKEKWLCIERIIGEAFQTLPTLVKSIAGNPGVEITPRTFPSF